MQDEQGSTIDQSQLARVQKQVELTNQFHSGANWFWWIAGVSVINSLITWFSGSWSFVVGLGFTQVVDAIATELIFTDGLVDMLYIIAGFAILFDAIAIGLFVLFGYLGRRRFAWVFIVGMVLYACDALIFLAAQSWLELGFHGFALFCLYGGYNALKSLRALEQQSSAALT